MNSYDQHKTKFGSFKSSRDLSPNLKEWCDSVEGQAALRKSFHKKKEILTPSESAAVSNSQEFGRQLNML